MGCIGEDEEENEVSTDDGPKVRSCTDIFMLVLFIVFWFVLILIAAFALVIGNPKRLLHGYDSFGNICGSGNEQIGNLELSGLDMTSKPYLFYLDVSNISKSLKICVSKCPNRTLTSMRDVEQWYNETGSDLCRYGGRDARYDTLVSSSLGPCPVFPVYESNVVLHRCVPRAVTDVLVHIINSVYSSIYSWDAVENVLADIYTTWPEILLFCFLAFLVSLLVIAILHFLASIVAWIFMIAITITSLACTAILWWTYVTLAWELEEKKVTGFLIRKFHNEQAFLTFSIIATILTIILLLLVIVMRKHVGFISEVFKESAKCLADIPALFLQPVITFLVLLAFFAFWTTVAVSLATANYAGTKEMKPYADLQVAANMPSTQLEHTQTTPDIKPLNLTVNELMEHKSFTLVQYVDSTWVKYMWWFHLIGLIWTAEFILACQQMVIAGAVASWYFQKDKKTGEATEDYFVLQSIRRLLCYHLGSVALGSFLITIFKIPRLILMYLQTKLKAKESETAKVCLRCCFCCFYCVECFIKFMNHNAYTVVAMQGHGFCTSARIAFKTIMNNVIKFTTLNSAGDFVLFLGKVIVTLITTIVAIIYLKRDENLHFYAVPVLLVAIFAFFIAHAIISLYEGVVDTMFLCLCEDSRMNREDGKWKQSKIVAVNTAATEQELTPINS